MARARNKITPTVAFVLDTLAEDAFTGISDANAAFVRIAAAINAELAGDESETADEAVDTVEETGADTAAIDEVLPEEIADLWQQIGPKACTGEVSGLVAWEAIIEALGLEGITPEQIETFKEWHARALTQLRPVAREVLHDLARAGARLGLVLQMPADYAEIVAKADWMEAISLQVTSGVETALWPEPRLTDAFLAELEPFTGGVAVPGRVLVIDAEPERLEAARARKFGALLLNADEKDNAYHVLETTGLLVPDASL